MDIRSADLYELLLKIHSACGLWFRSCRAFHQDEKRQGEHVTGRYEGVTGCYAYLIVALQRLFRGCRAIHEDEERDQG
jgi:hypothetical protein